jgi:peptidoglycan hydrolase-like protein with peptidoglycan-binding domain/chitodextrinase
VSATTQATTDTTAPTTPTNLTLVPFSDAQINLSWTASTDAVGVTGYRVERCQGTTCTTFAYIATSTTNSYVNTGLAASTAYRYRVRATDAAGNNSAYSTRVSTTTKATPPPADTTPPTLSSVSVGSITTTGATISWNTNENADTQVEYGLTTSYGQSTTLNSTLTTTHSQSLTALSSGTLYHYRVKSKDAAGNSAVSLDNTFTTQAAPDTQAPNTVSGMSAGSITQTSALLTWTAPSDLPGGGAVASYDIRSLTGSSMTATQYSSATQASGEPAPATPGTAQTYTLAGLSAGTQYAVALTSRDAAGNVSALSNIVTFTTQAPPPPADTTPPTLSSVSVGSITTTGATISWNTNENADTQVEYGLTTSYGQSTTLNSTLTTTHSQSLTALSSGTLYHYRVKSKDAAGNLAQSSDLTFTTLTPPDTTPPTTPTAFTATPISTTQVNLTWSASTDNVGVTGYRIERCTGVSCTSYIQIVSIGTSSLAYTDTGLTANTSYGYRVRAVDAAGNLSPYSTPASVTTQSVVVSDTTPPSLSAVTVSGSASSLTWTWTTNELADTKVVYGTSSNVLTTTLTNSTLLTSHTLTTTNLIRRTTYYYQVISKDAAGNTSTSTTGSFLTAAGRTAPITNLQAANGSVILTWNRTNDPFATSLVIYRSTSGFPTASSTTALSATITDLSATTFRDVNVSYGQTYYYSLYALDDQGIYSDPANVSFTPTAPAPTASSGGGGGGGGGGSPSVVTLTPPHAAVALGSPDQITLTWKNPTDTSFVRTRVLRKEGNPPTDANDGTVVYEGTGEQFTDTKNLNSSTTYHYAIFALDQSLRASSLTRVQAKLGEKTALQVMQALAQVAGASTTTPSGVALLLSKNLKLGMQDAEVLKLQTFLMSLGLLPQTHTPTTYFGALTQAAVIKFQKARQIDPAEGYVGPTTRKVMAGGQTTQATQTTSTQVTRVLQRGATGAEVILLQDALKAKGYLPADHESTDLFGALTEKAVKQFQCTTFSICSGTPATTGYGRVGGKTRAALGW